MSKYLVSFAVLLGSAATAVPAVACSTGGHCPPENSGFVRWEVGIDDSGVALGESTPLPMPYCYMGRPLPPDMVPPPCRR